MRMEASGEFRVGISATSNDEIERRAGTLTGAPLSQQSGRGVALNTGGDADGGPKGDARRA